MNNNKLIICYTPSGYNIMCEDGTPMVFVDGSKTEGIHDLKYAIKICVGHGYQFEVV